MSAARPSPAPRFEVGVRAENHTAALRSRIYAELAAAFDYPSNESASARIASGATERELRELLAQLDWPLSASLGAANAEAMRHRGTGDEAVDVLHCSLFDSATGASAVSLYERDYAEVGREVLWEDLFRCYTHFGLEFDDGGLAEAPDLLTIELEFMHYLAFLEASNPESSRGSVLGQADFLQRHLAAWTPRFCDALAARAAESVYRWIAALLREFIAADRGYLESKAHELRRHR